MERREFLRRWGLRLGIVFLLVALGLIAAETGRSVHRRQMAHQARVYLEAGETTRAADLAHTLLRADEKNVAACRVLAELAERANTAEAVTWRKRIFHLEPGRADNHLDLAAVSLRFNQIDLARHALEALPATFRASVRFQALAAELALATANPAAAEHHFAQALAQEPENVRYQVGLARLQLAAPNRQKSGEARGTLRRLTADKRVRTEALRALAGEALEGRRFAEARSLATALKEERDSSFDDTLLLLEAAHRSGGTSEVLPAAKAEAGRSCREAARLISWLNQHVMMSEALEWSALLPPEVAQEPVVRLALAESYGIRRDWRGLQTFCLDQDWGEGEAARLAVLSHAHRRLGGKDRATPEADTFWRAAVQQAADQPARLLLLAELADGWDYAEEAEAAYWSAAAASSQTRQVLTALERFYRKRQNTHGLLRVARRLCEVDPGDLAAANKAATLGLLLMGDVSSRRLAARMHQQNPQNAAFACTHAFALLKQGRVGDALQVMEALPPSLLRQPPQAAYYVMMLVEDEQFERAGELLPLARQAELLPEEQQLLLAASRKIAERAPAKPATELAKS